MSPKNAEVMKRPLSVAAFTQIDATFRLGHHL
jgi:hypothetical protein